jgi:hypothetical protein
VSRSPSINPSLFLPRFPPTLDSHFKVFASSSSIPGPVIHRVLAPWPTENGWARGCSVQFRRALGCLALSSLSPPPAPVGFFFFSLGGPWVDLGRASVADSLFGCNSPGSRLLLTQPLSLQANTGESRLSTRTHKPDRLPVFLPSSLTFFCAQPEGEKPCCVVHHTSRCHP